MIRIFFIFLICANVIKTEADWGYPEIDDAVVLNPINHDQFIKEYDEVLVYYYLPGCKYCVYMDKFFGDLALEYKEKDDRIPFATFNCNRHINFCANHAIPSFPFVKFYIRGHPLTYYGERNKKNVDNYIKNIMMTVPKTKDEESFKKIINSIERDKLVMFYIGKKTTKPYHIFDLAAKYYNKINFYHLENIDLEYLRFLKIFEDSTIKESKFKNGIFGFINSKAEHFNGYISFDNLDNFIYKLKHPDLIELGPTYQDLVSQDPQQFMVIFLPTLEDDLIKEFERFGKDHKKEITLLVANQDTYYPELYSNLKESLLIEDSDIPCVRIFESTFSLRNLDKFKFPGELGYNYYQEFLRAFKSSSIFPYLKVENLQVERRGNFKVINSYSFQDNIRVSGQDSILLYHSDIDMHEPSKKMFDALNKLSVKDKYKSIKFFMIDADKNELKSFFHDLRPVVLLYSKRNLMRPIVYEKEANLKMLKKFIKSKRNVKKNNFGKGTFLDKDL